MTKTAAIYARVSSDRQKESGTIASEPAAVRECARTRAYIVPPEWVFEDDGFSGTRLDRPGLEAVRDLAAEGRIEAVLMLSPDRLRRKYAYQVLLLEEFARCGVACEFVESPPAETPQERLLVQVQGMIAEYERAQIAERSRRGKRHKARNGSPSVLSVAPYGYRYVKRSEGLEARYEVLAGEAEVVRQVFDSYAREHCSMRAIARHLTEQGIPTRTGKGCWERSVIWAILRNPAYCGSRGPCESRASSPAGRWPDSSVRARSGSRSRWRPWLARSSSSKPRSSSGRTSGMRGGGQRSRPCCRACWCAGVWLCLLPLFHAYDKAKAVLLPLPGLGRVALRRWRALCEELALELLVVGQLQRLNLPALARSAFGHDPDPLRRADERPNVHVGRESSEDIVRGEPNPALLPDSLIAARTAPVAAAGEVGGRRAFLRCGAARKYARRRWLMPGLPELGGLQLLICTRPRGCRSSSTPSPTSQPEIPPPHATLPVSPCSLDRATLETPRFAGCDRHPSDCPSQSPSRSSRTRTAAVSRPASEPARPRNREMPPSGGNHWSIRSVGWPARADLVVFWGIAQILPLTAKWLQNRLGLTAGRSARTGGRGFWGCDSIRLVGV